MVDIHFSSTAKAPASVAFAYVNDYANTPEWMFGISSFTPLTDVTSGVGARFDGVFKVPPVKLHSVVECTDWKQDALISLNSIKGFRNWSTWTFEPLSDDESRLTVDFTYVLPGGIAGRALGKALEPIVALTVKHSEHNLRKHIEAAWASEK